LGLPDVNSADLYFRRLLREAQTREQEARLEALLLEGLAVRIVPLDDRFRQALEAKVEQILGKHQGRP
jgi:O-methyltransferase involved in polyketide biosynthesis